MRTRIINLHKWFPGEDELAARIARLCILREDFLFEFEEYIKSRDVPVQDEYGPDWRQTYFFRRMCVTLREIRSACEELSKEDRAFKRILRHSQTFAKYWRDFKTKLNSAMSVILPVRDAVSAHISLSALQAALNQMSGAERFGFLQISSERPVKTHYKFTDELLVAMMLKDVAPEDQEREARERANKFLPPIENLLDMMHALFSWYVNERGLTR